MEQYEFYVDESGGFGDYHDPAQDPDPFSPPRLVGGIVVPPELVAKEQEVRNELEEIRAKHFPQEKTITGIHLSEIQNFNKREEVRNTLKRIFLNKLPGAQIAFIYDLARLEPDSNTPGAQFYRNMLVHLLQAVFFYHPFFSENSQFRLRLAHRRFGYNLKVEEFLAGQGYLKLRDGKGSKLGLTEFTAITQADLKSIMDSLQNVLRFQSRRQIHYEVKPYKRWDNPFMVFADWVCNILFHILIKNNAPKKIHSAIQRAFGEKRIMFYSSSGYDLPEGLLSAYFQRHFGDVIAGYLERGLKNPFSDEYLVLPGVRKALGKLHNTKDTEECCTLIALADKFLEDRIFPRLGEVETVLKLVQSHMDKITAQKSHDPVLASLAYRYHDAALRLANHTANTVKGLDHMQKGLQVFRRIPGKTVEDIRRHHEFINRASVFDSNSFAFERGNLRLQNIAKKEKEITRLLSPLSYSARNKIYGKICGSMGQNFAFIKKHDKAWKYFSLAREHLGENNIMQASFRAHLALDENKQDAYLEEISLLFNFDDFPGFEKCVETCLALSDKDAFTLHLISKGVLIFLKDQKEKNLITKRLAKAIDPSMNGYRHHPWELIFIVLGRLLDETGDSKSARKFWCECANFLHNDG